MEVLGGTLVVVAAGWVAWRVAPVSTALVAAVALTLVGSGAVDPGRLPLAGEVAGAKAAVERWQAEQAHRGACYIRGMSALEAADEARLAAVEADCPAR